jgi:hypothetical protein
LFLPFLLINYFYGGELMVKKFLLVLLLIPVVAFAQSSGKLAGVVVDKSTGEPLPGVNVILEGTSLGSATDIDGYFVVLNVPVGRYDVRANYIGYKDVVVEGIRVSANITSELNFDLEPTTLELEEAIVITAERPLVEKNVTQSVSLVTSQEIQNIPVRGFNNIMSTQKSVTVQDNNLYIRGGRADEVGYYIDGASSVDPLTNTQSIYVIQEAVEEFQVLAGGYTAEFGGANSGIIRTELKTGASDYHVSLDFQTDKFTNEGNKFLGTHTYRQHYAVMSLSGPILSNKIRFFLAGENIHQGDREVRFGKGFELAKVDNPETWLIDDNPQNPKVSAHHPDTVKSYYYPDGFTPQRGENQWAFNGTLLFDYSPIKFRMSGSYSNRLRQRQSFYEDAQLGSRPETPTLAMLNNRSFDDRFENLLLTGKLTYIVNPTSLLDLSVNYFYSLLDREDSYFGNDWVSWWDSSRVADYTRSEFGEDQTVTYQGAFKPEPNYLFNGFYFARDGAPYRNYRVQNQRYISGALNYVSQIGRHHEVKLGADIKLYKLRRYAIRSNQVSLMETENVNGIYDVGPKAWVSNARPNNYGYDIYGRLANEDQYTDIDGTQFKMADAPKEPVFYSVYFQDKMEFNDLIINFGLRFDRFDTKSQRLLNPENPSKDDNTKTFNADAWEDVEAYNEFSPRLGFSFPVSEKTVFYMQYGKFVQMPELETMFAGEHEYNYEYIAAGFAFSDPVGYALEPVRTTSYEIGFRQQLGRVAAFDLAGFYRNVRGQVQMDQIIPAATAGLSPYNILMNGDFATTQGLELSVTLRRIQRLQGQLNYTFTSAEGTGSTRGVNYAALEQDTDRPSVVNPLDFEQTHRGSIILDYRFAQNDGGAVLRNLGLNVIYTFNSGHPFTFAQSQVGQADAYSSGTDYNIDPRYRRPLEAVNSSKTPWFSNLDLRVDKTFSVLRSLDLTVYARVLNVLNTQNVINVFPASGSAYDDGFYNNPNVDQRNQYLTAHGEQWFNQYQAININNGQAYWDQIGNQLFAHPRQIFLGIKLTY